jgi:prepilin-type processing-associated H-X9-DG protein
MFAGADIAPSPTTRPKNPPRAPQLHHDDGDRRSNGAFVDGHGRARGHVTATGLRSRARVHRLIGA